jgi:hypothetical protein
LYEVLLLHFLQHLLINFLVIVGKVRPFTEKGHGCLKDQLHILGKALSFEGPGPKFQPMGACLDILVSSPLQKLSKVTDNPVFIGGKQMACVVKDLQKETCEAFE